MSPQGYTPTFRGTIWHERSGLKLLPVALMILVSGNKCDTILLQLEFKVQVTGKLLLLRCELFLYAGFSCRNFPLAHDQKLVTVSLT